MNREDVIKRLEMAIEGSRELDANIAAMRLPQGSAFYVSDGDHPAEVGGGEWLALNRTDDGRLEKYRPPHYTGSIDAALSLIPKGLGWEVSFSRSEHTYVAGADTDANAKSGRYDKFAGRGKSAPLAICSAALKALAETNGEG